MSEGIFAKDQVGVPESWAGIIANIDVPETPLCSMLPKGKSPVNTLDNWQAKKYKDPAHVPVPDGADVAKYENLTERKRIQGRVQKIRRAPRTSDFAENVNVVDGMSGTEHTNHISDALVLLKRGKEARLLSDLDSQEDDGSSKGSGTRGLASWIDDAAQGDLPVPEGYRTPTANIYRGALNGFSVEDTWRAMSRNMAKERKSSGTLHGFCGIDLRAKFTDSTLYTPEKTGYAAVRSYENDVENKTLLYATDIVKDEGGTLILHTSHFLYTTEDGATTDRTHRSGLFLDMDMLDLSYNRMPNVKAKEDEGGGPRAIVDAIFMLRCFNPLGMGKCEINSDN